MKRSSRAVRGGHNVVSASYAARSVRSKNLIYNASLCLTDKKLRMGTEKCYLFRDGTRRTSQIERYRNSYDSYDMNFIILWTTKTYNFRIWIKMHGILYDWPISLNSKLSVSYLPTLYENLWVFYFIKTCYKVIYVITEP